MPGGVERACHWCISKIASSACFVFLLFAFLALPLSMAFTGMKFLEDCPLQPLIPLYLLEGGFFFTLKASLPLYDSTRMRRLPAKAELIDNDDDDDQHPCRRDTHRYYAHLLSLFLFLWFILGNYWVFAIYPPDFLPPFQQPQDYCDKTLYLFAVAVLLLSHTLLGLLVLGSGCVYMWSRWRSAAAED
uniref:Transmembrane protein 272 n=1 Tax=Sus scrofa TaxID=9823 RepID=A0A5G2R735_PIG